MYKNLLPSQLKPGMAIMNGYDNPMIVRKIDVRSTDGELFTSITYTVDDRWSHGLWDDRTGFMPVIVEGPEPRPEILRHPRVWPNYIDFPER